MADEGQIYGANGESVGATQLDPHFFERKALIEKRKEAYFGQLADVKTMPKNMGKTIIAVTHDDHYFHVADRVWKMDEGRIERHSLTP